MRLNLRYNMTEEEKEKVDGVVDWLESLPEFIQAYAAIAPEKVGILHQCNPVLQYTLIAFLFRKPRRIHLPSSIEPIACNLAISKGTLKKIVALSASESIILQRGQLCWSDDEEYINKNIPAGRYGYVGHICR